MRKFVLALLAVLFLCSVAFAGQGMAPGPGVKGYSGGGPDTTPPTLNSATIPSAGTSITLAMSESVSIGAGGNGGWVIMPGGTPTSATRNPTSDEAISGTWDGTAGSRYTIVNDYPDSAPTNYLTHGTTTAGYLTFGFSAFSIPAGSTNISVDVLYYDYRASGTDNMGGRIKVGGTYYDSATHQPTAAYTLQTNSWATNPKTTTAWTVDDVNGAGANALQAFGFHSTDANPAVRVTSILLRVNYTPPDSITYSSGSGSSSLVYTLPWTAACQTTYTGYYTQPGNGVEDTAGNDLASITSPFSVTNSMPPPAPTGHSTVAGNALCTMHPGTANCAASYKYYYKVGSDPTTVSYDGTGTSTDGANVTSLSNGTTYRFAYLASSANGDGVLSTIDTCTPAAGGTGACTSSTSPSGLHCEDFEGANPCDTGESLCRSAFTSVVETGGTVTVSALSSGNTCGDKGTNSLKIVRTSGDAYVTKTWTASNTLNFSFMFKYNSSSVADRSAIDIGGIYINGGANIINIQLYINSGTLYARLRYNYSDYCDYVAFSSGTWHDVRVSYTQSGACTLTVDGVQSGTFTAPAFATTGYWLANGDVNYDFEYDSIHADASTMYDPCQ